jgi:hypothetical protein
VAVLAAVDGNGKDSGALRLVTGSLSLTDIAEHDTSSSTQIGIGLSASSTGKGDTSTTSGSDRRGAVPAGLNGTLDLATSSSQSEAQAKAAIGQGSITLTGNAANDNGIGPIDLAALNRDITATRLITKDARSGLVLQADSAAITDTIALGKDAINATCTSTACTTAQSAITNPLALADNSLRAVVQGAETIAAVANKAWDSATATPLARDQNPSHCHARCAGAAQRRSKRHRGGQSPGAQRWQHRHWQGDVPGAGQNPAKQ